MHPVEIVEVLEACRNIYLRSYNVEDFQPTRIEYGYLIDLKRLLQEGLLNQSDLLEIVGVTLEQIIFLVGLQHTIKLLKQLNL